MLPSAAMISEHKTTGYFCCPHCGAIFAAKVKTSEDQICSTCERSLFAVNVSDEPSPRKNSRAKQNPKINKTKNNKNAQSGDLKPALENMNKVNTSLAQKGGSYKKSFLPKLLVIFLLLLLALISCYIFNLVQLENFFQ